MSYLFYKFFLCCFQLVNPANVLFKRVRRPNTKLRHLVAIDTITNGNDSIQMIEIKLPGNFSGTVLLNYPDFPDS